MFVTFEGIRIAGVARSHWGGSLTRPLDHPRAVGAVPGPMARSAPSPPENKTALGDRSRCLLAPIKGFQEIGPAGRLG